MKRDTNFLVRQLKVKNSIANHFSYSAGLCVTNVTVLYLTDLTSFAVISTEHYCVLVLKEKSV